MPFCLLPVRPGQLSSSLILLLLPLLGACAVEDSRVAERAQTRLVGLPEVDLEACLGVPDQHGTFGNTDILTYYATSSSSTSYSIPIVGGISLSNGGYCHATFRVDGGHVTQLLYSGEKNATLAPSSYCAPILRTCMSWLDSHPQPSSNAASGSYRGNSGSGSQPVPPGATSAAPQPGASMAASPSNVPTASPR